MLLCLGKGRQPGQAILPSGRGISSRPKASEGRVLSLFPALNLIYLIHGNCRPNRRLEEVLVNWRHIVRKVGDAFGLFRLTAVVFASAN